MKARFRVRSSAYAAGWAVVAVAWPATLRAQVNISSANPPTDNPYVAGPQPFRDVLQTGTTNNVTQGIGAAGTPAQNTIQYAPLSVTFSAAPTPAPTVGNIAIACTGGTCPTVNSVTGSGAGPYSIGLSGSIPPGHCTTLTFAGTNAGQALRYQYLPGDMNMGNTVAANDIVVLLNAINNGQAAIPANLARYNVNRVGSVSATDLARLVGLLNGVNTTQVWTGVAIAACAAIPTLTLTVSSAVCLGGTTTATLTAVPAGGTCQWQAEFAGTGQITFVNANCTATITGTAASSAVDDVTLKVSYTLNGVTVNAQKKLTVARVRLKQLDFAGAAFQNIKRDDNGANYATPHWLDNNLNGVATDANDRRIPACYKRNSTVSIANLTFDVAPNTLALNGIPAKGAGPDGDDFMGTGNIAAGALTIAGPIAADDTLPNTVKRYNTYNIAWTVAVDGTNFCNVGTSDNRVYETLETPTTTLTYPLFETALDIGCRNADGQNTVANTVNAIWGEFTDLDVRRKTLDGLNVPDGVRMGYWRPIPGVCQNLAAMLASPIGNGACGAWADLLVDCLRCQGDLGGVTTQIVPDATINPDAFGFLVKNWWFGGNIRTGVDGIRNTGAVAVDDDPLFPMGNGFPNTTCLKAGLNLVIDSVPAGDDLLTGNEINTGPNGVRNTIKLLDDEEVIPNVGEGKADMACITAGPNGAINTAVVVDDMADAGAPAAGANQYIRSGPNGINNSPVAVDDAPIFPVGNGFPNYPCIWEGHNGALNSVPVIDDVAQPAFGIVHTGLNGRCQTGAAGDDRQIVPVGNGRAFTVCVSAGVNGIVNTAVGGDDVLGVAEPPFAYTEGASVVNLPGIAGQDNPEPPPFFQNHFVVRYTPNVAAPATFSIYDPSYGAGPFATEVAHEDAAIDGISNGLGGAQKNATYQELLYVP